MGLRLGSFSQRPASSCRRPATPRDRRRPATPRGLCRGATPALLWVVLAVFTTVDASKAAAGSPTPQETAPETTSTTAPTEPITEQLGAPLDAAAVLADVRTARLLTDRPLPVRGLKLDTGFVDLILQDGFLFPAMTEAGHLVEVVFIGEARLRFETDDEIESGQLELFTGGPVLDETFTEAVMLIGADAAARALVDRPSSPAPDNIVARAQARYLAWLGGPVRGLLDVESAAALDRLGAPLYRGHFSGSFNSASLGEILISNQPESTEQLVLGRFQPLELEGRERRRAERRISRLRRRGRFLDLTLDDLGTFDVWVSMAQGSGAGPNGGPGEPSPGLASFEPSHYRLQADLNTSEDTIDVIAHLDLEPQIRGALSVGLTLPADLQVHSVTDGAGEGLVYLRDRERLRVFLGRPTDAAIRLRIAYGGKGLLSRAKAWLPIDNLAWYPRTGTVDRATYELEVTWPDRYELVASGTVVAEEKRGRRRWQRRRLDTPGLGVSFAVGQFKMHQLMAGDTPITLALDNSLDGGSKQTARDILGTVASSLTYFEQVFGDYPLDSMSVVTLPSGLSQSLPGYIQLSNLAMEDDWIYTLLLGLEDRRTVIAHEVSHQWWGNQIGWKTYRDQWISEAMANYSALLWARYGAPESIALGLGPTAGWESALGVPLADGRPLESVGPMVLGERLSSSRADAYSDIVYKKGAVVIDMLAGFWGERAFVDILGRLTRAAAGYSLSTEDFFALVGTISGQDLEAFADRFVYGTGLPEIYYDYRIERRGGGSYKIHLEAEQETPYRFQYRVVETPRGLDVTRRRIDQVTDAAAPMAVPFLVELDVPQARPGELHTLAGRLVLDGPRTELSLDVEQTPVALRLDPLSQVFGSFYSRAADPKRVDYRRAYDAAAGGDDGDAEKRFRAVLETETPPPADAGRGDIDELREVDRLIDWRTRLQLARLALKSGQLDKAAAELDAAGALRPKRSRSAKHAEQRFAAHLDLLRGDVDGAHRALKRLVRRQDGSASPETWLLLAIAAEASGRLDEARDALESVADAGVDAALLEARLAP
ncbi:MAG: M1 family aminopeptidase [Acidobacteriota bacterium]